jgi:hypothetical protein
MNTSFAGNQVGSFVSLDITNSYPIGNIAQLGPYYNYPQGYISNQINYTANQADIISQDGAAYAAKNIELEKSGTLLPNSAAAVSAKSIYINGANTVNYFNQNAATIANAEYVNAYAIEKSARDASYSAYLTTEASQIRLDRISTLSTVMQLVNTPITINPLNMVYPSTISTMVTTMKQDSQQDLADASGNVQDYLANTQVLLNNTIIKSSSVTSNRKLVAAFNLLVKVVAEAVSFPLLEIAGKETLVTQNIPSIILTVATRLANQARSFLTALTNNTLTTEITAANSYANLLDSIARSNDINMYKRGKLQKDLRKVALATRLQSAYDAATQEIAKSAANAAAVERLKIAVLTDASGYKLAEQSAIEGIAAAAAAISPIAARSLALNADTSAVNARAVLNAMISLNTNYTNTITKEPIILITASESLSLIESMLAIITTITNNTSARSAVAITRRASNTIQGILKAAKETEEISLESFADALSVLNLLNIAYTITPAITDTAKIQQKLWAINAASARAAEISEKLKQRAFSLNRTAHNLVTPQKLAVQTASANANATINANNTSKLNRTSRNVYTDPPTAYTGFKAEIRANIPVPIRPTLDELVYLNRIQPLRLDSLRTVRAVEIKVAQDVQKVLDNSVFSYRQQ